jgi:hypothetical protein
LLGSEDALGVPQRFICNTGIKVTTGGDRGGHRVVAFTWSTGKDKLVTSAGRVLVSGGGQDTYCTPLGRVVESFLAHYSEGGAGVREACVLFAKAAATARLDAKCMWRANLPHADHFLSLDRHDLTRMASPYQNVVSMGSKAKLLRPGEDTCSQFRRWTWTARDGVLVKIWGEGPHDFEELGIPILRSNDPRVVKALAERTFRGDYPLARYPLIQDELTGSLVSRHGQVYARKTLVGCGRRDPNKWSLRKLYLGRTLYPRFSRKGTTPMDCHSVMARLTNGKRPDDYVVDHVGQDNKEDFSEVNLEYVTQSENASRHHAWKKDQAARSSGSSTGSGSSTASGSSTTRIETVQASANEWKNERKNERKNEGKNERKNEEEGNRKRKKPAVQTEITQFLKRVQ